MIHTIDLEYLGSPRSVASYVVRGPAGVVMVETGPGSTTETLTRGLAALGLTPADVGDVLLTHIHLDHAGAAGWMASHGARVHVHAFGRPHLVDPSRLLRSAQRIYGDSMERRWGAFLPIPEDRVVPVRDGDVIEAGGLRFTALETPGHARHHHAYALDSDAGRVCFTGDAAACHIGDAPTFISLPTPPPEFELGAWIATLSRLERGRFDTIYPTHFGPVPDPAPHLARVRTALRAHVAFVRDLLRRRGTGDDARPEVVAEYRRWYVEQAEEAGLPPDLMPFYVSDTLPDMNVAGIARYWTKLNEKARPAAGPVPCGA